MFVTGFIFALGAFAAFIALWFVLIVLESIVSTNAAKAELARQNAQAEALRRQGPPLTGNAWFDAYVAAQPKLTHEEYMARGSGPITAQCARSRAIETERYR